jgi:hypothetical protein
MDGIGSWVSGLWSLGVVRQLSMSGTMRPGMLAPRISALPGTVAWVTVEPAVHSFVWRPLFEPQGISCSRPCCSHPRHLCSQVPCATVIIVVHRSSRPGTVGLSIAAHSSLPMPSQHRLPLFEGISGPGTFCPAPLLHNPHCQWHFRGTDFDPQQVPLLPGQPDFSSSRQLLQAATVLSRASSIRQCSTGPSSSFLTSVF